MLKKSCVAITLALTCLHADEGDLAPENAQAFSPIEIPNIPAALPVPRAQIVAEPVVIADKPFSPFTGKIKGKKVRLRVNPDLESRVVRELTKSDMVVIIGEKGDFYAVEPPPGTKAYVFRSFVLDGIVEGNRVNVRLEPSIDAPIISHLNSGDRIKGAISSLNNKWYEISPPSDTRFYIAKEYVEYLGGPEVKVQLDKKRTAAEQLLDAAALLSKVELQKPFNEMDLKRIQHNYDVVLTDYAEFTDLTQKAKESLANLNEVYTQKKISFLEDKAGLKVEDASSSDISKFEITAHPTDRMKLWEPVEESLYLSWSSRNDDRSLDDFYEEQRSSAVVLSGLVEPYSAPVKNKPGDFILRDKDLPVAYLYSTHINLQDFVGKKITVVAAPRSNKNFAFPAYYVLSVE